MELTYSNMYLIICEKSALIIDPNNSNQVITKLVSYGVNNVTVLLTHEHLDHTCGLMNLKEYFKTTVVCTKACADFIGDLKNNRSLALMGLADRYGRNEALKVIRSIKPFAYDADIVFDKLYALNWLNHSIKAVPSPGHSPGGCCFEIDGNCIFTGDALVPNYPVLTRFPGGSMEIYEKVTLPYLESIDANILIYPGHGEPCRRLELIYNNGWYRSIKP